VPHLASAGDRLHAHRSAPPRQGHAHSQRRGDPAGRCGRFGAHNLHENHPLPTALRSEDLVFGAYFNAGVRIHDVSNPRAPREVGYFVPAPPERAPHGAAQMNDVYVDENGIIYAIERFTGGLYILEQDL
jgi:hypothetical protein